MDLSDINEAVTRVLMERTTIASSPIDNQFSTSLAIAVSTATANIMMRVEIDDLHFTIRTNIGSELDSSSTDRSTSWPAKRATVSSPSDITCIITAAFVVWCVKVPQNDTAGVDTIKCMHAFSVESLAAVKILNGMFRELQR